MTFNIGSQSGGIINNVAGDQTITGGQNGLAVSAGDARKAAGELVDAMRHYQFPADSVGHARQIQDDVRTTEPNKSKVAASLDKVVRAISSADAWLKVGAGVVKSIRTLAMWLGPLGGPILGLLPAFI